MYMCDKLNKYCYFFFKLLCRYTPRNTPDKIRNPNNFQANVFGKPDKIRADRRSVSQSVKRCAQGEK